MQEKVLTMLVPLPLITMIGSVAAAQGSFSAVVDVVPLHARTREVVWRPAQDSWNVRKTLFFVLTETSFVFVHDVMLRMS